MSLELNVQFNDTQITIYYADFSSVTVDFVLPLTTKDREALRHYLEVYATQYVMDIDDAEAERMTQKLAEWGHALFDSIFSNAAAQTLFTQFINTSLNEKHLLTITAKQPEILSLPWELLHHAGFLFSSQPSVTILRRVPKIDIPVLPPQTQLHILLIVSRPSDENFIDPRTDARAVLQAIESFPFITIEFLQPATFEHLWQRLQNNTLPRVDVIHFDGHGYFDKTGALQQTTLAQSNAYPRDLRKLLRDLDCGANTGYLLFEKAMSYDKFYVPTSWLVYLLSTTQVRLVVLSACQSAMVAHNNEETEETEEEPIGSVAVGLVASGIPSVLAMSYSVMVRATELLFGEFYQSVATGHSVGVALDRARHQLLRETQRRTLQRGQKKVAIHVKDWFLPTLYQAGAEMPLLFANSSSIQPITYRHNLLPLSETGFWGRRWELWQIENWFIDGIRRVVISGFSGQGKTFLAQELGRWLLQKRYFDAVVFVDYSSYQGIDAVQWAVTSFSSVFEQSVIDVAAVDKISQSQQVLLILDNLEVYATDKQETLQELLTVADRWSHLGDTRVVITTRPVNLQHQAYQSETKDFRQWVLGGLSEPDAVDYFEQLLTTSENPVRLQRDELLHWFRKVQFHPLSLGLLARCLNTGDLTNLETRLNQLILELSNDPVKATLQLVIEQLDEESQQLLPLLGVFEGGALESMLEKITELSREQLLKLLSALITTGLIHPIPIAENLIYLQFHPTLAPVLWSRLNPTQQAPLRQRYQQFYYQLSQALVYEDQRNPLFARAVVKQELSNLLAAVKGALADGSDEAVAFVSSVNRFLMVFGLQRDRAVLTQQAATLVGACGSDAWYLSQTSRGQQLYDNGQYAAAATLFSEMLETLSAVSEQRCLTLHRLGRCLSFQGQAAEAITCYQQELTELDQLEQSDSVVRQKGGVHTDLADALTDSGQFEPAQQHYEQSLAIDKQLGDQRGEAVTNGQLGTLALLQGDLAEAERRYHTALELFQQFHEPLSEATVWTLLGNVYKAAQQWNAAETAYRRAAHLCEAQGQLQSAATTWNQLAMVTESMGKWTEAEAWYRKAMEVNKQFGNAKDVAIGLNNLADLLRQHPERLTEARQLAEQALAIDKTLDPAAAEIWLTYNTLAKITEKQGDGAAAKAYRRLSREAKMNYAGTQYELERDIDFILGVVAAVTDAEVRQALETALDDATEGQKNLAQAIRQILAGERDAEGLCEPLDCWEAPIVLTILEGIANPESVAWLSEP